MSAGVPQVCDPKEMLERGNGKHKEQSDWSAASAMVSAIEPSWIHLGDSFAPYRQAEAASIYSYDILELGFPLKHHILGSEASTQPPAGVGEGQNLATRSILYQQSPLEDQGCIFHACGVIQLNITRQCHSLLGIHCRVVEKWDGWQLVEHVNRAEPPVSHRAELGLNAEWYYLGSEYCYNYISIEETYHFT